MATNSSTMNVTDLCRLCAAKDDFTKDLMDESNKNILNLIQELIQIKIYDYDNMSTKICLNCEEKLFSFHLFILECKKVQETMRNMSTKVVSDDVKIKEEIAIKSEIKDEYLAEDIISQTVHDDDFPGFDRSADDSDRGSLLEEDFSIAALKRLKKKQVVSKTLPEGKVVNLTDLLKLNNLSDFVRMICKYCDKEFANFKKLSYHCNRHHMCKPVVQCICGLEMKSKTVIYKHVQDHKVIANNLKQERKYINVKETNLVNFDCNICQEKFCSYYSLKAHSVDKHGSSPVIQCQCGALLKSKSVLYKHIAEHKKPNVFSCDKCSKIVKSLSALEKHKLKHIPKEDRTFECDSCDRTFNTKESLKSHVRCHIPIEQRKQYECEICFLKFTTRSSALSHKRVVHDKIKAYVCDLCGYACGTNGELRQHRAIHSDDKPFVCSKCSKRFKTYSNLKTHMDTHEETSYMCYVCSRILNSRRTLKKHLLVHENECRHICSYCNKAFKRRQTLKVHMSTHTGDKPLSCKWCDERFAYASTLRSHRLRYHPDKMIGGHAPNPYAQDYNSANHVGNEENLKSDGNVSYTENVGVSKSENITR